MPTGIAEYEFIIVGSGAGGGPLAANLAKDGYSVLLLEAGRDLKDLSNKDDRDAIAYYETPVFHPLVTEHESFAWNYYVKHYSDPNKNSIEYDSKYRPTGHPDLRPGEKGGILYPRAGTLGGCTAHHAMIMLYPHNSDWEYISNLFKDDEELCNSWKPDNMRRMYKELEECLHVDKGAITVADDAASRHGYDGWMPTNQAPIKLLFQDKHFIDILGLMVLKEPADFLSLPNLYHTIKKLENPFRITGEDKNLVDKLFASFNFDPNDFRVAETNLEGFFQAPFSIKAGKRRGVYEYIDEVREMAGNKLAIETDALVTRLVIDNDTKRVTGVDYLKGQNLYRASPKSNLIENFGEKRSAKVSQHGEVILSAGAFNTPQILMLSGIGPKSELDRIKEHVKPIMELEGVGKNLQDRYEITVVNRFEEPFEILKDCKFLPNEQDNCYKDYRERIEHNRKPEESLYSTNGLVLSVSKKSSVAEKEGSDPDLYIFSAPTSFTGYYPGYSKGLQNENDLAELKHQFTWAVLKGHTNNTGGTVKLNGINPENPRQVPEISFNYFEDGKGNWENDLQAVYDGVKHIRKIMKAGDIIEKELVPGNNYKDEEDVKEFIKREAWGHHASCTCAMGTDPGKGAVVDGNFKVHGMKNLRIVDASVFPKIPGIFIVIPIYMISQKAYHVIKENYVEKIS